MYGYGTESELWHIGNENSGRYPRGSGERPNQHHNKPKMAQDMSNDELEAAIKRRRAENNYNKLYPEADELKYLQNQLKEYNDEQQKAVNDVTNYVNKIIDTAYKATGPNNEGRRVKFDRSLEEYTDDELRKQINRMNMERQYLSLIQEREAGRNKKEQAKAKVHEVLSYAGPVVSTIGGVVTIGLAIKNARQMNQGR